MKQTVFINLRTRQIIINHSHLSGKFILLYLNTCIF